MKGRHGHGGNGLDAALAAIATLTAAWPVSTLLAEPTWLRGAVLLIAVIASTGVGARSLALRGWQVVMVQLVAFVLAASTIYGQGQLWYGLPTLRTLGTAASLIGQALTTVRTSAAPAPTTPGLIFVVGCALALAALAVDYLAVTRRSPSMAGLPLLTVFLAAAANSSSSLPVTFFVAAAGMWLIMVAREGSAMLRRWGTTVPVPHTPSPQDRDSSGVSNHASSARMLGAVALAAAVALPVVLPQLPARFLLSGLGRSSSAVGGPPQAVGLSLGLDLTADLTSRNTTPVLRYTTTDPSPPPLRVAVSSLYRSSPGLWVPARLRLPALSINGSIHAPAGLAADVPRRYFEMRFTSNLLEGPNLAAPQPLISADLGNTPWGLAYQSEDIGVASRPDSYSVSYWALEPTATMLESASASPSPPGAGAGNLTLDQRTAKAVTPVTERVTAGKTSAYDKAVAIQQYLRATGGFTYSLTLAPPPNNTSAGDGGFDPLANFLVTKKGYCVQFATAMVMMSREAGIPARMAIGFLPGTANQGVWTVTASDAHTWPELYLDGLGWTRFEPTPTRGALPAYTVAAPSPGKAVQTPPSAATAPNPSRTAPKDLGSPSTDGGTTPSAGLSLTSALHWLTRGPGLVLLAPLVGLLAALVVPTAARLRRRRRLVSASTTAQRVEVQWELLTSSLDDLGIPPAPARTPRQMRAYYNREAFLDGADSEALGRVVQVLERSRYALSPPALTSLAEDARQVLRAAAANRPGRDRLRAALWPGNGLAELHSARADLTRRVRSLVRDVSTVVQQWFARRRQEPRRPTPPT